MVEEARQRRLETSGHHDDLVDALEQALSRLDPELVDIRRDLHAHPELSWHEERTTALVGKRLADAGVRSRPLTDRTGLVAEVGPESGPTVVLRADLDALPVPDRTGLPWASTVPGVAHACGHDLHTTALLGAGLALASLAQGSTPGLDHRVRLLFQPAEEVMPGGALAAIADDVLEDAVAVYCLHCDPTLDVGSVGLREGAITGAADSLSVRLTGQGGHTSRPHLTQDLTFALAKLVTELPAVLSRRLDPRAGASVVWGVVSAGAAMNVIPATGHAAGTVRMLDADAWAAAEPAVRALVDQILEPYGVGAEVTYVRGVPPVVNAPAATAALRSVATDLLGADRVGSTPQSLGGEDFAWYLEQVPGAMARLGTRAPGGPTYDLHQGDLVVDEAAVGVAARLLARLGLVHTTGTSVDH